MTPEEKELIRRFERRYRLRGEAYERDDRDPWWDAEDRRGAYLAWLTTVKREQIDRDFWAEHDRKLKKKPR